jgi:hypothetical protein
MRRVQGKVNRLEARGSRKGSGRKRFFFEKKNQKTSFHWSLSEGRRQQTTTGGIPTTECLRR